MTRNAGVSMHTITGVSGRVKTAGLSHVLNARAAVQTGRAGAVPSGLTKRTIVERRTDATDRDASIDTHAIVDTRIVRGTTGLIVASGIVVRCTSGTRRYALNKRRLAGTHIAENDINGIDAHRLVRNLICFPRGRI